MQFPGIALDTLTASLRALDTLLARDPAANSGAQTVATTVLGRAPDGQLVVAVNGRSFTVPYDGDVGRGQTIQLPARLLAESMAKASAEHAAAQGPQQPAASAPQLTSAARLLATLPPVRDFIVRGDQPLATDGGAAKHLAQGLKNALAESGLFYESHVAEWARGERPLNELAREPQMQWTRADAIPARTESARPDGPQPQSAPATSNAPAQPAAPAPGQELVPAKPLDVPLGARELIAQQLAVHDARRIAWQGDVWPGQPAHIAVEDQSQDASTDPALRTWRITLATELPQLGRIEAEIQLAAGRVSVSLRAAAQEAMQRLAGDTESFRAALAAAGVPLIGLTVKQDG